jgi:hypothetical protein
MSPAAGSARMSAGQRPGRWLPLAWADMGMPRCGEGPGFLPFQQQVMAVKLFAECRIQSSDQYRDIAIPLTSMGFAATLESRDSMPHSSSPTTYNVRIQPATPSRRTGSPFKPKIRHNHYLQSYD